MRFGFFTPKHAFRESGETRRVFLDEFCSRTADRFMARVRARKIAEKLARQQNRGVKKKNARDSCPFGRNPDSLEPSKRKAARNFGPDPFPLMTHALEFDVARWETPQSVSLAAYQIAAAMIELFGQKKRPIAMTGRIGFDRTNAKQIRAY